MEASTKLFTELTTLAPSLVAVATCVTDGLDGSAVTEFLSALTEDVMALVSLGKSPLAELTSVVASVWICLSCDLMPLTPLLVSPLTEFSRLVRSVQYAGLLLLQPARVTAVAAAARTKGTRTQALPWRVRDLSCPGVIFIMTKDLPATRGRDLTLDR